MAVMRGTVTCCCLVCGLTETDVFFVAEAGSLVAAEQVVAEEGRLREDRCCRGWGTPVSVVVP